MKKVLIAYYSATGETGKMAGYIAEGVRFSGQEATIRKTGNIKSEADIAGYDGYIFGSPTFSQEVPEPMKKFLIKAKKAGLKGKLIGAFGSYSHDIGYKHDIYAPAIIFDEMLRAGQTKTFELGPFALKEDIIEAAEGMKACQEYGKVFGENL
jgi:flavodoxin